MSTDVIEVLEKDHAEIDSLFEDVQRPDVERAPVLQEIIRRVAAHIAVERSLIAPAVRQKVPSGRRLSKGLVKQHRMLEQILVRIEHRKANSPDMPDLVTELLEAFEGHTQSAAKSLFPAMRGALDSAELEMLGDRVLQGEQTVQSHPHPHLLALGPINRVLLPVAALVDRLRDRTVDNP